jgi:hypothetical protein
MVTTSFPSRYVAHIRGKTARLCRTNTGRNIARGYRSVRDWAESQAVWLYMAAMMGLTIGGMLNPLLVFGTLALAGIVIVVGCMLALAALRIYLEAYRVWLRFSMWRLSRTLRQVHREYSHFTTYRWDKISGRLESGTRQV